MKYNYNEIIRYINNNQSDLASKILNESILKNKNLDPLELIKIAIELLKVGDYQTSLKALLKSIEINPKHYTAYTNIGVIYFKFKNDLNKAIDYFKKSVEINSKNEIALYNLGCCFGELNLIKDSIYYFEKTLNINPDHVNARFNLALKQLIKNNFKEGWQNYEARKKTVNVNNYKFPNEKDFGIPENLVWRGKKNCSKIFVHSEQGIGDEILISSLYKDLRSSIDQVNISCDKRLIPIFKSSFPEINFFDKKKKFNVDSNTKHIFSFSLCQHLRLTELDFINNDKPWIKSNLKLEEQLRNKISSSKKIIGISWKSNQDFRKNIELKKIIKIFPKNKYTFINLQYGDIENELNIVNQESKINIKYFQDIDYTNDLETLCSLINICDLIVTSSNITAHFAGALSKKTYLLLPTTPLFYWGLDGSSLWYPKTKILRQKKSGDWTFPLKELYKGVK